MRARHAFLPLAMMLGFAITPAAGQERAEPVQPVEPRLLDDAALAAARGGQTIVVNNQTFQAANTGGTIGSYAAGAISLSDNALSGFNGIGNFVINTGAQNNLQAGMTLTINMTN